MPYLGEREKKRQIGFRFHAPLFKRNAQFREQRNAWSFSTSINWYLRFTQTSSRTVAKIRSCTCGQTKRSAVYNIPILPPTRTILTPINNYPYIYICKLTLPPVRADDFHSSLDRTPLRRRSPIIYRFFFLLSARTRSACSVRQAGWKDDIQNTVTRLCVRTYLLGYRNM